MLRPGQSVVVPLPPSSPLFTKEGVTHVIHVLGPNMNPGRPDCLNDDYTKGCKILRAAYTSLFEGFVSIVKSHGVVSKNNSERSLESGDVSVQEKTPFKENQNGKREAVHKPENSKKSKPDVNRQNEVEKGKITKRWASWSLALYQIAMHPCNHAKDVLEIHDDAVVINDAYPKVLVLLNVYLLYMYIYV